jgi:predicted transcriptional regulator
MHMAAQIARLRTKADRLRSDTAAVLRQLVLTFDGLPERARGEIVAAIDRETASEGRWTFVMLSPEQNAAVVRWLRQHSQRPVLALALWSELFTALRRDTGEIMLTRDELAERVGASPGEVSRVMHELASIGAIIIRREKVAGMRGPGRAVYIMNPTVATNLTGGARDKAQAAAPRLQLVETEPG